MFLKRLFIMILNLRGHPAWTAEPFLGRGANPGISDLSRQKRPFLVGRENTQEALGYVY